VLGVIDSYGTELICPGREGRSPQQIGRKGKSNKRWIVGGKLLAAFTEDDVPDLATITEAERVAWDYQTHFAARVHPISLIRRRGETGVGTRLSPYANLPRNLLEHLRDELPPN
jgi:hypothetical protein